MVKMNLFVNPGNAARQIIVKRFFRRQVTPVPWKRKRLNIHEQFKHIAEEHRLVILNVYHTVDHFQ